VPPVPTRRFDRFALDLGRGVVLTLLALLPFALAELAARLLSVPPPIRRVYDPFAYRIPQPGLVDSFVGPDGQPVTIRLNELGMRGPSTTEKVAPDTSTLVFLGGSTTENYAYPDADTFPAIIGDAVAEKLGHPVRVWNAGASAATSGVSLGRLQHQVLDLQPSLVVVMHGINDLLGGFHPGFRPDSRHLVRPALADHRPRSYLLTWVRGLRSRVVQPSSARTREAFEFRRFPARLVFERNIRSMAAIATAHGIPILFLSQPTMFRLDTAPADAKRFRLARSLRDVGATPPDVPSLSRGMRAFNATTLALPSERGGKAFDLAARMSQSWKWFYDECHYTREGNRRVAAELSPVVTEILRSAESAPRRARRR